MSYVYRADEDIDRLPVAPYVLREVEAEETYPSRKFDPTHCGTKTGYQQHRRYRQPQCPECYAAYNEYQRQYRARKSPRK